MGIVNEARTDKRGKKGRREIVANCVIRTRAHSLELTPTQILYALTHNRHTESLLQASETCCHYVLWRLRQIWPNGFLN